MAATTIDSPEEQSEQLERRFRKLEAQHRRTLWLGGVAVLALGFGTLWSNGLFPGARNRTIRAGAVVAGEVQVSEPDDRDSGLVKLEPTGLYLSGHTFRPGDDSHPLVGQFTWVDLGKPAGTTEARYSGAVRIGLHNFAQLKVTNELSDERVQLQLFSEELHSYAALALETDHGPGLRLDSEGKRGEFALETGGAYMGLLEGKDKPALGLLAGDVPRPGLFLRDRAGDTLVSASTNAPATAPAK